MQNIAQKFLKAKTSYSQNASVQKTMREKLISLLEKHGLKSFESVFEFGAGLGEFTHLLSEKIHFKTYIYNDINDYKVSLAKDIEKRIFDMNELALQNLPSFDLITSNACLQWLDAKSILHELDKFLCPKGILLLSSFLKGNLWQIKQSCKISLEYLELKDFQEFFKQNYELLELFSQDYELKFKSPLEVFKHLKASGVNSLGHKFLSKSFLKNFALKYDNTLTYRPVFILARKKT